MIAHLWLVRHGESVANIAATAAEVQGSEVIALDIRDADVPLSDTGREQAVALGRWVAEHAPQIDAAWTSPYLRARETLALAVEAGGVELTARHDERLRDRELGVLDLLTRHGVAARHPEEAERRRHLGKYYHRPPGGESWADVALRLRSFLRDLPGDDRSVLLVAHDAVVMLIVGLLVEWDEETLLDFAADNTVLNASVTHLAHEDGEWRIVAFADVGHLDEADVEVTVHPGSPDVEPE